MSILIAIDHGNDSIKTPHFLFRSGLSRRSMKPPIATDTIECDGGIYTLSSERISYMRDKTRDENFFILTLFAVAKELERQGHLGPIVQVNLACGLPLEHLSGLKEAYIRYLKRDNVRFVYNDQPCVLSVRHVFIYPQDYAAVANKSSEVLREPRMFIIGIGGYTVDVLLLRYGKPENICRSLEIGVIDMYNEIVGQVNAKHDMLIDEDQIVAVLKGLESGLPPNVVDLVPAADVRVRSRLPDDVVDTIHQSAKQHADKIINKLRELKVDLRATPVTFVGGGALLLQPFIDNSPLVLDATFEPDPKANAAGYEVLAQAALKKLYGGVPGENAG